MADRPMALVDRLQIAKARSSTAPIRAFVLYPWHLFEWLCEWTVYGLSKWAFIDLVDRVAKLGVVVAVATLGYDWIWVRPDRIAEESKERHTRLDADAWRVIYQASGLPGDGGRTRALRRLADRGYSLANLDLSRSQLRRLDFGRNPTTIRELRPMRQSLVDMRGVQLVDADLTEANLSAVDLRSSDLSGAKFWRAKLYGTLLHGANLNRASFLSADMRWARFGRTGLMRPENVARHDDARIMPSSEATNLRYANFGGANLTSTSFGDSDMRYAVLDSADLSGALLTHAIIHPDQIIDLESRALLVYINERTRFPLDVELLLYAYELR